jgi:hypothetical protein
MAEVHPLWPEPPEPMSPARSRLRAALAALAEAEREAAAAPVHRLEAVRSEAERLAAELAQLLFRTRAKLGPMAPPVPAIDLSLLGEAHSSATALLGSS